MRTRLKILHLFISCFVLSWARCSSDHATKDEWQGEILVEDGVEITLNPDTPVNQHAGYDLSLEEALRISDKDADGAFYFSFPRVQEAKNGSIFVGDEQQLLKFSPGGKFLGNFFKAGQGPGEIAGSAPNFSLWEDSIYVYDTDNKILWMNQDGRILSEHRIDYFRGGYEGLTEHWEFFLSIRTPLPSPSFLDWGEAKYIFQLFSRKSIHEKKEYTFTLRAFRGRRIFWSKDRFYSVLDSANELIYVSHLEEYSVSVLDLNQGRVLRRFQRDYPRVRWATSDEERKILNRYNIPLRKYWADIYQMYVFCDQLWVETSYKDERGMTLIDVFDAEGKYVDNFFLRLDDRDIRGIAKDCIYMSERDEDEFISIVKYRIVNDSTNRH